MSFANFLVFTLLFGLIQGIVIWIFREDTPPKRQEWIDAALHKGGVLLYAWYATGLIIDQILLLHLLPWDVSRWLVVIAVMSAKAFLARVLVFDLAINTARSWYDHREGRGTFTLLSAWSVGTSAASDKFVNWLTIFYALHVNPKVTPTQVRLALWLQSCVATFLFFHFL